MRLLSVGIAIRGQGKAIELGIYVCNSLCTVLASHHSPRAGLLHNRTEQNNIIFETQTPSRMLAK